MRKPILKQYGRQRIDAAHVAKLYKHVEKEYLFNADVFCEDPASVRVIKQIVSRLDVVDRTIIILYSELGSTRELGKVLNVSFTTAKRTVNRIKKDIISKYNAIKAAEDVLH